MHILILASGYPTEYSPNQGIFFRDQAESLARNKKNQVAVIATVPVSIKAVLRKKQWSFGAKKVERNDVRTFVYTFLNLPKVHRYRMLKSRKEAARLISEYIEEFGKPDVIHIHGFQAGLQAMDAKKKFGIPYVITEHSSQFIDDIVPRELEPFAKSVFEAADEAIAVSASFAQIMTKRYGRKFQYIPNVVDTTVFQMGSDLKKNSEFTFFNAAAFVVEKNHPLLLEAFSRVLKIHPECRLRLAGAGPDQQNAREYVKESGMENQVEFLGVLPRNEIVKEMQQMDAFVLSSKVETFGVVLIEALSCGKPVISTKCFGPESIVTSPEVGILSEQNAADLASAMVCMIENYSGYQNEIIRKYAIDQFSDEVVMNQLMNVYQTIVSKSNI